MAEGLFSKLGKRVAFDPPGPEHALEAARIANRDLERRERLSEETPPGPKLYSMAKLRPEVTEEALARYLEELSKVPHQGLAALRAGLLINQVRKLELESSDFAAAVEMAKLVASGVAEEEAFRRAIKGVAKPVFHQGVVVGTEQQYSDQLMSKILEANEERYARKQKLEGGLGVTFNWLQMVQIVTGEDRSS